VIRAILRLDSRQNLLHDFNALVRIRAMHALKDIFSNPFVLGLIVGFLPCALAWKSTFAAKLLLKKEKQKFDNELRDLQAHLNTHLKINASGNEALQKELDQLRAQNETLRINLAAIQQKPGRAEIRYMQITEAAVRTMREQAPGFAPAWERALREAELSANDQDSGLKKLMRKVMPSLGLSKSKSPEEVSDTE